MFTNISINLSLGLDKFFLSKKEKNLRKIQIVNTLNESSNSINNILVLEKMLRIWL